ncbi:MAG: NADH-quinone oxidoreductase subunit F [Actinobacteria bacterium QS_8_72_14]|nr:MAG: NADH-quinone oxidoreductase subunit F [Actinobacteria bacterium QS_8_72_14]
MAEPLSVLTSRFDMAEGHTLEGYVATGGYASLDVAFGQAPTDLVQQVKDAGLRGRGGAGFPTGVKWGFTPRDSGKPVYLAVNADEGEPGTFKDRELMERDPHQLLEGIVVACYMLESRRAFIFLRGEYVWPGMRLEQAIAEAYEHGYLGKDIAGSGVDVDVTLHYAAGAYICGEETAMLDALEGRRGQPRLRPPFPAVAGLYGMPTQVNNVETIMNVGHIVQHGIDWYRSMGTDKSPGPKVFCVSGEVARPGNYEWPMGTPAREIVDRSCGGMLAGRELKFWAPGGSSTPLLTADHADTPMDFDSIAAAGSLLGTAAMMMYSDHTSVVEAVLNWTRFYEHESCGKCTPCREGFFWLSQVYERLLDGRGRPADLALLDEQGDNILGRAFCALGDGGVSPITSSLTHFRDEYEHLVAHGRLPDGLEAHAGVVTDNSGHSRPDQLVGSP